MTVDVLLFGQLKDVVKQETIKLHDVSDTKLLLEKLHGDFPALRDYTFVMALNKKTLHESSPLQDGDLVALLPAFSGG